MGQTAEQEGEEGGRSKAAHIVAVAVVVVIQPPLTLTKFLGSDIRPAATLLCVSPSLRFLAGRGGYLGWRQQCTGE